MRHDEVSDQYRGHAISVAIDEDADGSWSWTYTIDRRISLLTGRRCPDAAGALEQGLSAARARVDELEDELGA